MLNDKVGFFGWGIASYDFGTSTSRSSGGSEVTTKHSRINLSVAPGVVYFLTDRLALEATMLSLYFNRTKSTARASGMDMKSSAFGLDARLGSFSLGLQYYFRRNKSE